jgi:hypothetical protein
MAGRICHSKNHDGYIKVSFKSKKYFAHRLAWFYMTGEWPQREIDHINGIRNDNRWSNLRLVSRAENTQNRSRATAGSETGILGVHKTDNKITACICVAGKQIHLGTFPDFESAEKAYLSAKAILHAPIPAERK